MLSTLKRKSLIISLTVLVLMFTTKIVNGCSYDISDGGVNPSIENDFYSKIYFIASVLLILVIFVSYFLRSQKELWLFIITIVPIIIIIPLLLLSVTASDCGYWLRDSLGKTVVVLIALSALHLISRQIQINKSKTKLD